MTGDDGISIQDETRQRQKTRRPAMYEIIMLNDDFTTMEFVVEVLSHVFSKGEQEAHDIMLKIHLSGEAVVGVYTFDIAKTKVNEVHSLAASRQFPLKCIIRKT